MPSYSVHTRVEQLHNSVRMRRGRRDVPALHRYPGRFTSMDPVVQELSRRYDVVDLLAHADQSHLSGWETITRTAGLIDLLIETAGRRSDCRRRHHPARRMRNGWLASS